MSTQAAHRYSASLWPSAPTSATPPWPKAADSLISDTGADNMRISDWYRRLIAARSFLLLPITAGKRCVDPIYADRRAAPPATASATNGHGFVSHPKA